MRRLEVQLAGDVLQRAERDVGRRLGAETIVAARIEDVSTAELRRIGDDADPAILQLDVLGALLRRLAAEQACQDRQQKQHLQATHRRPLSHL